MARTVTSRPCVYTVNTEDNETPDEPDLEELTPLVTPVTASETRGRMWMNPIPATDDMEAQLYSPLTTAKPIDYPDFSGDNPTPQLNSPLRPEEREAAPFLSDVSAVKRCESARQDLREKEDKLQGSLRKLGVHFTTPTSDAKDVSRKITDAFPSTTGSVTGRTEIDAQNCSAFKARKFRPSPQDPSDSSDESSVDSSDSAGSGGSSSSSSSSSKSDGFFGLPPFDPSDPHNVSLWTAAKKTRRRAKKDKKKRKKKKKSDRADVIFRYLMKGTESYNLHTLDYHPHRSRRRTKFNAFLDKLKLVTSSVRQTKKLLSDPSNPTPINHKGANKALFCMLCARVDTQLNTKLQNLRMRLGKEDGYEALLLLR